MTSPLASNPQDRLTPVVLLGGEANALSVAHSLRRIGVKVYAIGEATSCARHSRCAQWIHVDASLDGIEKAWGRFLLSTAGEFLQGAALLALSDAAIRVITRHREELSRRYLLDESNPDGQLAMLDKLRTYEHARSAGVATPRFWTAESREQVLGLRDELVYPLLVKPRLSHLFEKEFGRKHVTVHDFDSLMDVFEVVNENALDVLLVEVIPGGDDQLCSYYTYMDNGAALFDFTKRIIRRYPAGMGSACYHITDWVPQIIEPSKQLLRAANLQGLANVEFKRDPRDGVYKLIECNARFTAANGLVAASGYDLAHFVYNRITGRPNPKLADYKMQLRLWDPAHDFLAFLELRGMGQITLWKWLKSISHRQTLQFFTWYDPLPSFMKAVRSLRRMWRWIGGEPVASPPVGKAHLPASASRQATPGSAALDRQSVEPATRAG